MGFFRNIVDAFLQERVSTTITVTIPTKLFMALETLVYLRNSHSGNDEEIDRDYIVGLALAHYIQRHLADKNEQRIISIPSPPEHYTQGRRQLRS